MRKALKYIAITLASLLVLLLTLPLCIYIPAIQRWGKNEICHYANQSTGMQLTIGELSLRFPFKLQIDDILLLASPGDTLLQSDKVQVGIAPAALPSIIGGMKQGWAFAWRSLMAAEIYVTILTGFGLGQLLHYGRELMRMDQVIGIMCVVIAIGLLIDKAIFSPIERNLQKKWGISSD